jgi:hypothetical protein
MKHFETLAEIMSKDSKTEELYTSDQKKRTWRSNKGRYTQNKGTFDFIHLIKNWEEIVGKMMASNTIPLKIAYKSLIISAKHPIFAQELGFLAPMIIEKIHTQFPELKEKITKIKFSHSNISSTQFSNDSNLAAAKKKKVIKKPKLHPYSPEYQQLKVKAGQLFSDIEDEEIRKMLTNFLLSN